MRQVQKRKTANNINLDYIDIREVLDDLNIPYSEQGKNVSDGWIGVQCPFPGCGDQSNHLGLHLSTPVVSCYNCGTTGNYLTFLIAELGSYHNAKEILAKHSPRELKSQTDGKQDENKAIWVNLPDDANREMPDAHREFLKSRKFNPDELDSLYNFHYCGKYSEWANRIIVPIYKRNRLITFTTISIEDDPYLRYRHFSKENSIIHCKNYLLGLEHVIGTTVIAVEGFFDMARIGPGCVCTFGTKITPKQKLLLSKFNKVIVVFDGDNSGDINGKKLANDLSAFAEVELITLEKGLDPDKLSKKDINELKQKIKVRW